MRSTPSFSCTFRSTYLPISPRREAIGFAELAGEHRVHRVVEDRREARARARRDGRPGSKADLIAEIARGHVEQRRARRARRIALPRCSMRNATSAATPCAMRARHDVVMAHEEGVGDDALQHHHRRHDDDQRTAEQSARQQRASACGTGCNAGTSQATRSGTST